MKNKAVAILLICLASACTKKNPSLIVVESPFQFEHDKSLVGTEFVAQMGPDQITQSQLLSPSPALAELESRINIMAMKHVMAQTEPTTEVIFAFEEPKDYEKALGLKSKKDRTFTFDPKMTGGIAKAGDKVYTLDEVSQGDVLMSRLMKDRFDQSIRALEGLFARRKILEASKAANVPMEQYIQEKILKQNLSVSDAEVMEFAQKNYISEKDLTEELKAQIKDTLTSVRRDRMTNDYAARELVKDSIHVAFTKPVMRLQLPDTTDVVPKTGQGPITVAVFSRWNCEGCDQKLRSLSEFVNNYNKYFQMSFLFNFPANSGEERMIAEAGLCLNKQQNKLFWDFVSNFDMKADPSVEESINSAVKKTKADYEAYRTCFLAREFKDQVDQQLQATQSFGFHKNPVVILDGNVLEDPNVQQVINQALDLKAEKGLGFNLFYNLKKMLFNEGVS